MLAFWFQAGLGQATGEFSGYRQGVVGCSKRYGATFADQVSSHFFQQLLLSRAAQGGPALFPQRRGHNQTS